jgi:hypothetical protein
LRSAGGIRFLDFLGVPVSFASRGKANWIGEVILTGGQR